MSRIFGDIPQCLHQRDDILIGARNWKEHNETLGSVFQRAEDYGITFNKPKWYFGQSQITFYGYRFDQEGLKPTPEKVQAIYECEPPRSKTEVRSFLGMTGYLSKFIPGYASLTKPLRDLTRTDTKLHEDLQKTRHLRTLRALLQARTLLHFSTPNYQLWYVWKLATMKGYQRVSSSNLLRVGSQYISLVDHWLMWKKGTVRQKRMRCVWNGPKIGSVCTFRALQGLQSWQHTSHCFQCSGNRQ